MADAGGGETKTDGEHGFAARLAALEEVERKLAAKVERDIQSYQVFMQKALAVAVASLASEACFMWLMVIFTRDPDGATAEQVLLCRGIYAVVVAMTVPLFQYHVSRGRCGGETLFWDGLKLLNKSSGTILGWGWKDFVAELIHYDWGIDQFVIKLVISVGLLCLGGVIECLPCFMRAKAKRDGGEDGLVLHFVLFPLQARLALGYAWNQLARHPVTLISIGQGAVLFGQVAYTATITWLITLVSSWNEVLNKREAHARAKKASADEGVEGSSRSDDHSPWLTVFNLLTAALAFVFAWAFNDLLNQVVFGFYAGCASPTACSPQVNVAYAACISGVFARLTSLLDGSRSHATIRKALRVGHSLEVSTMIAEKETDLVVNALSLVVGWAWTNAVTVTTDSVLEEVSSGIIPSSGNAMLDAALFYTAGTLFSTLTSAYAYHHHLEGGRSIESLLHRHADRNEPRLCGCCAPRAREVTSTTAVVPIASAGAHAGAHAGGG